MIDDKSSVYLDIEDSKFPEIIPLGVRLFLRYDRSHDRSPPPYSVSRRLTKEEDQFLREMKKHINDNYLIRNLVHDSIHGAGKEDA